MSEMIRTRRYRDNGDNENRDKDELLGRAKKRALYLLGERAFCRAELLGKLAKTYGGEIAEKAMEYIDGLGYINDEEYAVKYADYLIHRKKHGVYRAKREMLMKGLERELCDRVLAGFSSEEIDEELIELIEKRYSAKIGDFDDRRRTAAALVRRGYDFGSVRRCIDFVARNQEEDDFEPFEDCENEYIEDEEF